MCVIDVVPLVPSLLTRQYCHQLTKNHLLTTTTFCATFKKVCVLFICVRMQSGVCSVVCVYIFCYVYCIAGFCHVEFVFA